MLKELNEEIARNQALKPKPPQDTARLDRRVTLKTPVAASAAMSRKCYFDNECNSRYVPRAESNPRSFRMKGSPFTDEILSDPMPQSFRSISIEYDGRGDPEAHMSRFEGLMTLHQYSEGVKCGIFFTTLVNAAQRWFQQLPESSIACFEDPYQVFMSQFACSRVTGKGVMSLLTMKQAEDESLQSFSTRFNLAILEVPSTEPQLRMYAFIRGLRNGPFFDNLHTNPPSYYEELQARIPLYIQLEEARAERRSEANASKQKKEKVEQPRPEGNRGFSYPSRGMAPRIQPSTDTRHPVPHNPPRPDINNVEWQVGYTPLNRPLEAVFEVILNEPFFKPPKGYKPGEPMGRTEQRVCRFHNAYGHNTNDCQSLQNTVEVLVRQGKLDRFVRRDEKRPNPRNGNRDLVLMPAPHVDQRQLHIIVSVDTDKKSNRPRRELIRVSRSGKIPVMTVNEAEPEISIGPADARALITPHSDAMVCIMVIGDCMVHRVFVDTGSAVNIIYYEALKATELSPKIRSAPGPVYGFSSESVMPVGVVDLSLTLGSPGLQWTLMTEFLVMDLPTTAYNGILGRPTLFAFKAVVSMFYLKMKFPVRGEVDVVFGS